MIDSCGTVHYSIVGLITQCCQRVIHCCTEEEYSGQVLAIHHDELLAIKIWPKPRLLLLWHQNGEGNYVRYQKFMFHDSPIFATQRNGHLTQWNWLRWLPLEQTCLYNMYQTEMYNVMINIVKYTNCVIRNDRLFSRSSL